MRRAAVLAVAVHSWVYIHVAGVKPQLWRLFLTRPQLWSSVYFGPCTPVQVRGVQLCFAWIVRGGRAHTPRRSQFRLHGRHAWAGAAGAITDMRSHVYDAVGGHGVRSGAVTTRGRIAMCLLAPAILVLVLLAMVAVLIVM